MKTAHAPLATLVLLAILLAAGGAGYVAYFKTPDIVEPPAGATPRAAVARRALFFIIDGFAAVPPIADADMPTFARLGREGAHGVARTSSMSLTAPCVFSLGTGRPGTLTLGILDFHAPPVHVESLPSLVAASGKRVALAGDPSWNRQFGWLAQPEDHHEHPEPGITLDPRVRVADRSSVEFLFPRLRDPRYGLVVVHVSTADAVGHLVTPFAPEYREALTFIDGLLAETLGVLDDETVVLVTGDHGMGPRGTHGGRDDDATLTPYVLWGPGVRAGASGNVAQTALPPTVAALIGVPMPAASENPPATELLAVDESGARALQDEFLARKLAAARSLAPSVALPPGLDFKAANARLNEILFASTDRHTGARLATFALFAFAAVVAVLLVRAEIPASFPQPSVAAQLLGAFTIPFAFVAAAALLITWRSALPFQPDELAALAATLLGVGAIAAAATLYRSARAWAYLERSELTIFFWASVLLVTPLLASGWFNPTRYFQVLAVALVGGGLIASRRGQHTPANTTEAWLAMVLLVMSFYGTGFLSSVSNAWPYVLPAVIAVLALAIANVRKAPTASATIATIILVAGAVAATSWRVTGGGAPAAAMMACFVAGIGWAALLRRTPVAAAGLVIGVSTFLGLTMASDHREAIIFLVAGLVALLLSRLKLPLTQPRALYFSAVAALALRVALYFALGDQYDLASIRTAAGFRLAEAGLSLPLVIATLLLKYALPWFLIFAAALPSLQDGDAGLGKRVVHVLALGYAARFLALAAVADPFRVLPHGMEGLVGLFAISWAELLTFAAASTVFLALMPAPVAAIAVPARAGAQPIQ